MRRFLAVAGLVAAAWLPVPAHARPPTGNDIRSSLTMTVDGCTVTATYTWWRVKNVVGTHIEMFAGDQAAWKRTTFAMAQQSGTQTLTHTFSFDRPTAGVAHGVGIKPTGIGVYEATAEFTAC